MEGFANQVRDALGFEPKDFRADKDIQAQQMEALMLRQGEGPKEEYKRFNEEHPWVSAAAGFMPVVGQAQALADKGVADSLTDELLANLAMIPGVRPTRKVIAALDDLGEGGVKSLIQELEKAGIVDEMMIRRMFDGDGNLRMFHGSNAEDLEHLTHEGTKKAVDQSTDMWAGPGTYFASNLDSPTNIPSGFDLRVFEKSVPRDELGQYMVTNFFDSDLKRVHGKSGTRKFGTEDQTKRIQNALERMYPDVPAAERMELYDVSMMGTDSPQNVGDWRPEYLDVANKPKVNEGFNIYEDRFQTPRLHNPSDANSRALAHGIRGNMHSDSSGVSAAVFDPSNMVDQRTIDMSADEVKRVRLSREKYSDRGGMPFDGFSPVKRSKIYQPDDFLQEMNLDHVSDGWEATPSRVTGAREKLPKWYETDWDYWNIINQQSEAGKVNAYKAAYKKNPENAIKLSEVLNLDPELLFK